MEHKIANWSQFMLAGKAIFTIRNENTGGRFTFKVNKHREKDLWFVGVLTNPDNVSGYRYLGTIFAEGFRLTRKSTFTQDAESYKVFNWLYNKHKNNEALPDSVGIYHCNHCARCGRLLTVPESILTGFGPECMGRMELPITDSFGNSKLKKNIASLKAKIARLEAVNDLG